jgi:2'-5' RNA ligase
MVQDAPPSGIAVPIALPPGLAAIRERWDLAASLGALPHVTALYPFAPEADLTDAVRDDLAGIAATVEPFAVRFERARRFPGVVWVEPVPDGPFVALTAAIARHWPAWPPYGGLFDTVIPHLTIAESEDAPLEAVVAAVEAELPFDGRADRLELWLQDEGGRWRPHWTFLLGVRP